MGNGNKVEMLIAICAVISSIAAVFIAWDQARVMRSQEKADVWPILQLTHETNFIGETPVYKIRVQNAGVGPALVEDFLVISPDNRTSRDLTELPAFLLAPPGATEASDAPATRPEDSYTLSFGNLRGRVLRQGDEFYPIEATWDAPSEAMRARLLETLNLYLEGGASAPVVAVCYCSILDDCWVASTLDNQLRPRSVRSCTQIDQDVTALMAAEGRPLVSGSAP